MFNVNFTLLEYEPGILLVLVLHSYCSLLDPLVQLRSTLLLVLQYMSCSLPEVPVYCSTVLKNK